MARQRRIEEPSGGETTTGHHGKRTFKPESDILPCLVVRATPDGYVVGRALVEASGVEWISPTHVRPWTETRPTDVRVPAQMVGVFGGQAELKPARTAKGVPVATQVGVHVVFGELLDAAAHRAKGELKRMFDALLKARRSYSRHLCATNEAGDSVSPADPSRLWRALPLGEPCPHCLYRPAKASAA